MGVYWACAHFIFQRLLVSLSVFLLLVILLFRNLFVLFDDVYFLFKVDEIIVCVHNIDNSFSNLTMKSMLYQCPKVLCIILFIKLSHYWAS